MAFLLFLLSAVWADAALERIGLPVSTVDYIVSEFSTNEVIAESWSDPQSASPGSLLKPFVALAYGRKQGLIFPVVECSGETWLDRGGGDEHHGEPIWKNAHRAGQVVRTLPSRRLARVGRPLARGTPSARSDPESVERRVIEARGSIPKKLLGVACSATRSRKADGDSQSRR